VLCVLPLLGMLYVTLPPLLVWGPVAVGFAAVLGAATAYLLQRPAAKRVVWPA
jgi:hypothetical protein